MKQNPSNCLVGKNLQSTSNDDLVMIVVAGNRHSDVQLEEEQRDSIGLNTLATRVQIKLINKTITLTLSLQISMVIKLIGDHIFWTPGLPFLIRFIILPVEIVGIFTKPISLMVRLFVAITAGHIVLLSLICLTFIFKRYEVGAGSTVIVLFISLIELLVAGIQAYVFTLFSSLYIGMAIADHDDHH